MFTSVFVSCNTKDSEPAHKADTDSTEPQDPISGEVPEDFHAQIKALELFSPGELNLEYENVDVWGRPQIVYADDKYFYVVDAKSNKLISAYLNPDVLDSLLVEQEILTADQYTKLAKNYFAKGFKAFNQDTTEYICVLGHGNENYLEGAEVTVFDRQGNSLVNTGSISFTQNGTIKYIGGTNNSINDFDNTDFYNEESIKRMVFEVLAKGLPNANLPEKQPVEITGEVVEMPVYELFVDSIEDINFARLEKEKYGDTVAWYVLAKVNTSWGEIDPLLNDTYSFIIDAKSGEILAIDTLFGS